jgi:hypothetical protein
MLKRFARLPRNLGTEKPEYYPTELFTILANQLRPKENLARFWANIQRIDCTCAFTRAMITDPQTYVFVNQLKCGGVRSPTGIACITIGQYQISPFQFTTPGKYTLEEIVNDLSIGHLDMFNENRYLTEYYLFTLDMNYVPAETFVVEIKIICGNPDFAGSCSNILFKAIKFVRRFLQAKYPFQHNIFIAVTNSADDGLTKEFYKQQGLFRAESFATGAGMEHRFVRLVEVCPGSSSETI